jgi:hypothetical protein
VSALGSEALLTDGKQAVTSEGGADADPDHYQIDPRAAAAPALFAAVEAGRSMVAGAGAACEAAEWNV